jgi:hypothetical protein
MSLNSGYSVHRNGDGFGCQTGFISYTENSFRVLSRLFLGAESLGLARLVTCSQELNLVVSDASIVSPSVAEYRIWRGRWHALATFLQRRTPPFPPCERIARLHRGAGYMVGSPVLAYAPNSALSGNIAVQQGGQ